MNQKDLSQELVNLDKKLQELDRFLIEVRTRVNEMFWKRLIHIDAYRLANGKELTVLDFEQLLNNANNLIIIEWPENVKEILPEDMQKIAFTFIDENIREIEVQ